MRTNKLRVGRTRRIKQTGRDVNPQCKGRSHTAPSLAGGPFCTRTLHFSSLETQTGLRAAFHLSQDKNAIFQPKKEHYWYMGSNSMEKTNVGLCYWYSPAKRFGTFYCAGLHLKQQFSSYSAGAGHWDREHNPYSEPSWGFLNPQKCSESASIWRHLWRRWSQLSQDGLFWIAEKCEVFGHEPIHIKLLSFCNKNKI